jgi:UDP-N-acetyl-D-mannosaminuronic acid transferase (WecB/TagA/CpsF family)
MQIPDSGLKNKKKILIVSQYFWPENFRINEAVKFLRKKNHDVTVLTGKPNYPYGVLDQQFAKNPHKYNNFYGAKIIRVPVVLRKKSTKLNLFINYFSFNINSILFSYIKLRKNKFDFIITFATSPVTVALTSIFYKKIFKSKHIIWILDLWPEIIFELKIIKNKLIYYLLKKVVNYIYSKSDLILAQSLSFKKHITSEIYKSNLERIKVFNSWSEIPFINNKFNSNKKKKYNIFFTGNIGEAQNFDLVLKVIQQLNNHYNIHFTIVGSGRNELSIMQKSIKLKLTNITFVKQVPVKKIKAYFKFADALLLSLSPGKIISSTIPGKFQTYLSAGKPIIGLIDGETKNIINSYNLGFASESQNAIFWSKKIIEIVNLSKHQKEKIKKNAMYLCNEVFNKNKILNLLNRYLVKKIIYKENLNIRLITYCNLYNFNNNFILSGLNLAFIGTLAQEKLFIHKDMYHWPDGLFQKRFFNTNVKKISGRSLLRQLVIPRVVKKIYILGNASKKQVNYLVSRFNKPVEHISLPFSDSVYEIFLTKKLPKSFEKTDLIFITLPTPKQEHLANLLSQYKNYKIICIGGALSMIVGDEKPVPAQLENVMGVEAIWRLKTDTFRRTKRLISTLFHYCIGEIFGAYDNIKGKIINAQ